MKKEKKGKESSYWDDSSTIAVDKGNKLITKETQGSLKPDILDEATAYSQLTETPLRSVTTNRIDISGMEELIHL